MRYALNNYRILGLPTNISFLRRVIDNDVFAHGEYDTNFIKENEKVLLKKSKMTDYEDLAASVIAKL